MLHLDIGKYTNIFKKKKVLSSKQNQQFAIGIKFTLNYTAKYPVYIRKRLKKERNY